MNRNALTSPMKPRVLPRKLMIDLLKALQKHTKPGSRLTPLEAIEAMRDALRAGNKSRDAARVLGEWASSIRAGARPGETIARWLPGEMKSLVVAGDDAGQLSKALDDVVKLQTSLAASGKSIVKGVAAPLVYLFFLWATMVYYDVALIPEVVQRADIDRLTGLGSIFVAACAWTASPTGAVLSIGMLIVAVWFIPQLLRRRWPPILGMVRGMLEAVPPGIFTAIKQRQTSLQALLALMRVGKTPAAAFEATAVTAPAALGDQLADIASKLRNGMPPWDAIGDFPFDGAKVWIRVYAEKSGDVTGALEEITSLFEERMMKRVAVAISILTVSSSLLFGSTMLFCYAGFLDLSRQATQGVQQRMGG